MKIKRSDLNSIIRNYLTEGFLGFGGYPYVDDRKTSDAFRRWMRRNYPTEAASKDIDITKNSGATDWHGLEVAYSRYGDEFEESRKGKAQPASKAPVSKTTSDGKEIQGCVILCHWRGSKPLTKSMEPGLAKNVAEALFPQGHGGIILIRPSGDADYFDFGRYGSVVCPERKLRKLRNLLEKGIQQIPGVKEAIATGGGVRHKYLGKAKTEEYNPSILFDPVKAGKKHLLGMEMNTVSTKEAKRLIKKAKGLGALSDGECFICPDVGYVDDAYDYAMEQKKKCHLYSLVPITNNYNCGTFATHLAFIAGKGRGLRQGFWQMAQTMMDPTTQPAALIPHVANLMDYTDKVMA